MEGWGVMELNRIYNEDCLEGSCRIQSGSVDLILTDLPYGTVKGLGGDIKKYERLSNSEWDNVIDTDKIMQIANRILRKNGKMILTANQPFTTELISKAIPNLPHCYNMYWDKIHFANCLVANKAPVSYMEDILVFSKTHDHEGLHPLREYALKLKEYTNYSRLKFRKKLGHYGFQHFLEGDNTSSQFSLCTIETYKELIEVFSIDKMEGFKTYEELKGIDNQFASTFNLWEGNKYKSNILKYKKDYSGYHPTQKPVLLLEDLIKTFSNAGDLVVDLTIGSGSTAISCINTNRNYIGFELDEIYYDIANERINQHRWLLCT